MNADMLSSEPSDLLELAVNLVRRAGVLVVGSRNAAIGNVSTKTTDTDVVTAADSAAERFVIDTLATVRPGEAVLGEEGGEKAGTVESKVRWILDPIDGTVNYLYGLPNYAVSLAAEISGEVVAGVVRNPVTGEEWTAIRGQGARRDGAVLRGAAVTDLGQALVATGFGYAPDRRAHQGQVLAGLLPRVRDIRRFGAAAIDLCLAAEGRVDAYFEKGLSPWDYAAGALVAAEAGLVVSGLRGALAGPDMLLAAPVGIHAALHAALVDLDADGGP